MSHSILSPSSSWQWVNCPGSISMQSNYPRSDKNEAAQLGTDAHQYAQNLLTKDNTPTDERFTEHIPDYVEYIKSTPGETHIESKINIPLVHSDCFGTADHWSIDQGILYLTDLKYGLSPVNVVRCWQLICYALGITEEYHTAKLRIYQPRAFHPEGIIRTWTVSRENLHNHYLPIIHKAALNALAQMPELKPGTHCQYCTARHDCPALRESTQAIWQYLNIAIPDELSTAQLASELSIIRQASKLIEHRLKGIEQTITDNIRKGEESTRVYAQAWSWSPSLEHRQHHCSQAR